jgi:hypothetical protein
MNRVCLAIAALAWIGSANAQTTSPSYTGTVTCIERRPLDDGAGVTAQNPYSVEIFGIQTPEGYVLQNVTGRWAKARTSRMTGP